MSSRSRSRASAQSSGSWFGAFLALAPLGILLWATGVTGLGIA